MSDSESKPQQPAQKRALPMWAKALAAISVLLMVAGIALPLMGGGRAAPAPASGPTGVAGLTPGGMENVGDSSPATDPQPTGAAAWGPSVFRMGFSFFVGFAIAFALRSFVKLAIVALGFFFLALFGLHYAGLIEIKWGAMSERYDELTTRAQGAWDSMRVLLPSAVSASAGLFAGFWRRGG